MKPMLTSRDDSYRPSILTRGASSPFKNIAMAWLVLLTIVWGAAFSFMHYLLLPSPGQAPLLTPMALVLFRHGAASIVLIPFMIGLRPRAKDLWRYSLAGLFGVMGYQIPVVYGLYWGLPPVIAAILVVSSPLVVALLSPWLLKENLRVLQVAGIFLSVLGVLVLMIPRFVTDAPSWSLKALVALIAPVCWAGYTIWMKKELRISGHSPLALSGWFMFLGTLIISPICLVLEPGSFAALARLDKMGILSVLYLGVFATAGGQLIWNWSLKQMPASTVSVFLYLVPVSASLTSWYFRDQALTWLLLFGGGLVVFGLILVQKPRALDQG